MGGDAEYNLGESTAAHRRRRRRRRRKRRKGLFKKIGSKIKSVGKKIGSKIKSGGVHSRGKRRGKRERKARKASEGSKGKNGRHKGKQVKRMRMTEKERIKRKIEIERNWYLTNVVVVNGNEPLPSNSPLRDDDARKQFIKDGSCVDGAERAWQGCTMRIDVTIAHCSTCCCKEGFFKTTMNSMLLFGGIKECNAWFVSADQFARSMLSILRATAVVRKFTNPCWRSRIDKRTDRGSGPGGGFGAGPGGFLQRTTSFEL